MNSLKVVLKKEEVTTQVNITNFYAVLISKHNYGIITANKHGGFYQLRDPHLEFTRGNEWNSEHKGFFSGGVDANNNLLSFIEHLAKDYMKGCRVFEFSSLKDMINEMEEMISNEKIIDSKCKSKEIIIDTEDTVYIDYIQENKIFIVKKENVCGMIIRDYDVQGSIYRVHDIQYKLTNGGVIYGLINANLKMLIQNLIIYKFDVYQCDDISDINKIRNMK